MDILNEISNHYELIQQSYIFIAIIFSAVTAIRLCVSCVAETLQSRDELLTRIELLEDRLTNTRIASSIIPQAPPPPPMMITNTQIVISKDRKSEVKKENTKPPKSFDNVLQELANKPRRSLRFE